MNLFKRIFKSKNKNLDFIFESPDHIRYENSKHISGPNGGAGRVIKVEPHKKYREMYIVTIYNSDGEHPLWKDNLQMSPKEMRIMEQDSDKVVLRGSGKNSMGESFENYGLIVNFKNSEVSDCILRLYNKNVYIKYLNKSDIKNSIENNVSSNMEQKNKNGIFVENKIDGEKTEWNFVNDVKQGEWKMYFSNGKIKEIGNLNNGLPEGGWKAFNKNGTLRAVGQYENGKQTGLWKFNDEKERLRAEGNYINGQQKGKWIYYSERGKVESTEIL